MKLSEALSFLLILAFLVVGNMRIVKEGRKGGRNDLIMCPHDSIF